MKIELKCHISSHVSADAVVNARGMLGFVGQHRVRACVALIVLAARGARDRGAAARGGFPGTFQQQFQWHWNRLKETIRLVVVAAHV